MTDEFQRLRRGGLYGADSFDMQAAVEAELKRLKASREEKLREEDKKLAPAEHVFLSRHGTPIVEIRRSWVLALKAAGLEGREGLTPHSLRPLVRDALPPGRRSGHRPPAAARAR